MTEKSKTCPYDVIKACDELVKQGKLFTFYKNGQPYWIAENSPKMLKIRMMGLDPYKILKGIRRVQLLA